MSEQDPNARPPIFSPETEALMRGVLADPAFNKKFLRLLKEANPKAHIPAVDLEDQIAAATAASDKKVGELTHRLEKEATERRIMENRSRLKEKGYTQADIDVIEARMQKPETDPEYLPPNYDAAAKLLKYERQLAAPTPQIQPRREKVTEGLSKDLQDAIEKGDTAKQNAGFRQLAHQTVSEVIAQRAAQQR